MKSFSLLMSNLFIGLVRANRFLRPLSKQVAALGYQLFGVERPVAIAARRTVVPEVIACSERQGHTLLTEWTAMERPNDRKRKQIAAYQQVSKSDLVERAGVRVAAAGANSTWLVVPPESAETFKGLGATDSEAGMMLTSFGGSEDARYELRHIEGGLRDSDLTELLRGPLQLSHIPCSYLRANIEDLSEEELASEILPRVVEYAVRGTESFTTGDICRSLFPVWKHVGRKKQTEAANAVNRVLRLLAGRKYAAEWFQRADDAPRTWCIVAPSHKTLQAFRNSVQRDYKRFLSDLRDGPTQQYLPGF